MNEEAIFEIGNIIHVRRKWNFKKLKPEEIIKSAEYKFFKIVHPELCKLAEQESNSNTISQSVPSSQKGGEEKPE